MNLFEYVRGRPIFAVDPFGLEQFLFDGTFFDHDAISPNDPMANWRDTIDATCEESKLTVKPNQNHQYLPLVKGITDNSKNPPEVDTRADGRCATTDFQPSLCL